MRWKYFRYFFNFDSNFVFHSIFYKVLFLLGQQIETPFTDDAWKCWKFCLVNSILICVYSWNRFTNEKKEPNACSILRLYNELEPFKWTRARWSVICTLSSSSSSVVTLRISAQSFIRSSLVVCVDVTVKLVVETKEANKIVGMFVCHPKQNTAKEADNKLSYRITYFPFNEAGTQCMWPRWFKRLSKRSVKSFSPLIRNTTIPVASHRTAIEPHHKIIIKRLN